MKFPNFLYECFNYATMSLKFIGVMVLLTLMTKVLANVSNISRSGFSAVISRSLETGIDKMCTAGEKLIAKKLAPPLSNDRHKGQAGRIGIFGGSIEYTGKI